VSDPARIAADLSAVLLVQTITGLLWAGAAAARLNHLEAQLGGVSALEVRAARLEEQTLHLRAALGRIEAKLDRALTDEAPR
jgi:hypothetical protein